MLTNAVISPIAISSRGPAATSGDVQKVVIVNGSADMLEVIETVLDAGHYDVVFVESNERAYSQIKRVQPNLVILCVDIDDMEGFQVLSMLKLDADTRAIPVVTYTTEHEADGADEDEDDDPEPQSFVRTIVPRMN